MVFAFAMPEFAGQITTGVTEPPPPPTSPASGEITTGMTSDTQTSGETAAADSVTESC